jgi:hypothetical protein
VDGGEGGSIIYKFLEVKKEENVLTLEYNNENLISQIVDFIKKNIN